MLDRPITLEQPVYVPGNERHGVWASPLLETVFGPAPKVFQEAALCEAGRLNMRGDLDLLVFAFGEVCRSYDQLPARLLCDLVLQMRARGTLQTSGAELQRASLENEVAYRRSTPASSLKRIEVVRTNAEALLVELVTVQLGLRHHNLRANLLREICGVAGGQGPLANCAACLQFSVRQTVVQEAESIHRAG